MTDADFSWLMKQAKNERSKLILKQIQRDWKSLREKGQFVRGKSFVDIDMGKYKIWMRKCGATSSVDIYTEIFKENGHTALPEFFGKKDKIIVDVGANEGYYTLKMKQNNPRLKIISVEANPFVFQTLKKNVLGNKIKNVILVNKALTSKIGKITFEMVPEVSAIGSFDMGLQKRTWLKKEKIKKVVVNCMTLKQLCEINRISEIDILKLDVEGAEMEILKSSKDLLPNIKKIVVEYHSPMLRQKIKKFLKANNFRPIAEEKEKYSAGNCGDLYFIRK